MIILIVITLLIALGKAFDSFTYQKEKSLIYQKMIKWMEDLDSTRSPSIHLLMIDKATSFFNRVFQLKKKPVKSIFIALGLSWLLTTIVSIISFLNPACTCMTEGFTVWHDLLPWYPIYVLNFVFDFISIFLTIKILNYIKDKGSIAGILGISLDVILAYVIIVLCYLTFLFSQNYLERNDIGTQFIGEDLSNVLSLTLLQRLDTLYGISREELLSQGFEIDNFAPDATIEEVKLWNWNEALNVHWAVLSFLRGKEYDLEESTRIVIKDDHKEGFVAYDFWGSMNMLYVGYSLTTFIPTLLFLFVLLIMYISKDIILISKWLTRRFIGTAVEQGKGEDIGKFKPGMHFAILLGVLTALINLVIAILN